MKIGVFLFVVGVCCVAAFPVPSPGVPPQCADPTFACQDLESARTCNVVKSCIHDIWATMNAPDDNDQICDICKEMVKEARDQLLSNMTQEEIKEVFEGSCKLLPIKLVADACIKVVDEIIPQLVEMLASRMDPTMVCTISGLCNAIHSPIESHLFNVFKDILRNDDQCSECTQLIVDVQTFLKSSTEAEVKTYIKNICDEKLPKYLCNIVLNEYFDQIYQFLSSSDPKELCTSAGVCPKTSKLTSGVHPVGDELVCEFCEHVLEHIKEEITANTTVEEFRTALLNFCKQTGKFADRCTSYVNEYYDMLFNYIRSLDTKGLCTLMTLCGGSAKTPLIKIVPAKEQFKRVPLIRIQPAVPVSNEIDSFRPLVELIPAALQSKKQLKDTNDIFQSKDNPICDLCKEAFAEVEKQLKDPALKQQLEKALGQGCNILPKSLRADCVSFINQNVDALIDILQQELQPNNLCPAIGLCPSSQKITLPPRVKDLECDVCKDVVTNFRQKLQDPSSKVIVKTFLEEGCIRLPSSLAKECKAFVDENIDTLMTILIEELDPAKVCAILKICPSTIEVKHAPNDLECDLCKQVVKQVEDLIKDKKTEDEIKAALDKVCSYLPAHMATKCQSFVNQYTDMLITLIAEELDPDMVCAALNVCPASLKKVLFQKSTLKNIECDICKEVILNVENYVKDPSTEGEIKAALDKVCSVLPSSLAAKCESFVNQYVQTIITLLATEVDPDMICAALKVCPAKDLECEACQDAFHYLQEQLMNSDTQQELKNALKQVCSILPERYSENCQAFIDEYGSSLLALVAQEMDPGKMCFQMQMCPNGTSRFQHKVKGFSNWHLDECSVCMTVVDYMDKLLEEDDVDKEITALAEKVCAVIPSSFRNKCTAVLETYGPYILQMIGQMADSKQVCQEIDMCARSPHHVHLIGGSKCTFGPSYWCQSKTHASACKAESFCKTHIW